MTMRVIGAGLPRTGTASTRTALEMLGYNCFHIEALPKFKDQRAAQWHDLLATNKPHRWDVLLDGFDATLDFPGCIYWQELATAFPEAKVILTVRDPDEWFDSMHRLVRANSRFAPSRLLPRNRLVADIQTLAAKKVFPFPLMRASAIASFQRHVEKVRDTIPKDRLLVYRASQGWAPLCRFLGHRPPKKRFPRDNRRQEIESRVRNIFEGDLHDFRQG